MCVNAIVYFAETRSVSVMLLMLLHRSCPLYASNSYCWQVYNKSLHEKLLDAYFSRRLTHVQRFI